MSLSDLAAVGSFISGIAVLISLVYLSLQMRQSARNQQATIQHQRAALVQEVARQGGAADMIETAIRGSAGDSTINPTQSARYVQFALQCLWLYEEYYYQHKDGMLGQAGWATNQRKLRLQLQAPGFRAAWRAMSDWFEPDFTEFVNSLMKGVMLEKGFDIGANWTTFAAEEVSRQATLTAPT